MQIFVYEFITAAARWNLPTPVPPSLLAEGDAMLAAIAADFAAIAGVNVCTLRDSNLPLLDIAGCRVLPVHDQVEESLLFGQLATAADATLLIAPETAGELLRRCRRVEALGGHLLSPSSACIELATNKQATAEHLASHNLRVPAGFIHTSDNPSHLQSYPLIAKPIDGCGSQGVHLIQSTAALAVLPTDGSYRLEPFIPGTPASVALLCGPAGHHALPACEQLLSTDGRFSYLGGRLPLDGHLNRRAQRLATAAVATLPTPRGYIGIDLILGMSPDGSEDYVIEINPRLTTSYVGLRAASRTNLAAAILAVTTGHSPNLCFDPTPVKFTAEGMVMP